MSSFEFTPSGIRARDDADAPAGIVNAAAAVAQLREQVAQQEAARAVPKRATKNAVPEKSEPLKRRHFVKELRSRLKVVERQIKALRELEEEAAEIKRLIAAAKAPPAKVTDIAKARTR